MYGKGSTFTENYKAMLWKRHRRSVLLITGVVSIYFFLWLTTSNDGKIPKHQHKSIKKQGDDDKQLSVKWLDDFGRGQVNTYSERAPAAGQIPSANRPLTNLTVFPQTLLYNCSIHMGMSASSLEKNWGAFSEVTRRVERFLAEVSPLLPHNFSSQFKNPCWEVERPNADSDSWEGLLLAEFGESLKPAPGKGSQYSQFLMKPAKEPNNNNNKRVLCLPYFFLAGFPKSGTTTVHEMLAIHPNIIPPKTKEPHWWTRTLGLGHSRKFSTEYVPISFMSYTLFFKALAMEMEDPDHDELITYDGSQSTLWDSNFYVNKQDYCAMPAVMSHILPDAKFVVVMRNPVTRLYSHFTYSCQIRHGPSIHRWPQGMQGGMAQVFHRKVEEDVNLFNDCVKNASVFECSSMRTADTNGPEDDLEGAENCSIIWHRLAIGMYILHVKKWLQFYPLKNFLFIKMEDFSDHSHEILSNITNFLGINRGYRAIAEILRDRKNSRPIQVQPMDSKTLALLKIFYRPYNEELARLLNDSRFLWED